MWFRGRGRANPYRYSVWYMTKEEVCLKGFYFTWAEADKVANGVWDWEAVEDVWINNLHPK